MREVILIQTCKQSVLTESYKDRYPYPPIGLQYLMAMMKMHGYRVHLIDLYLNPCSKNEFVEKLKNLEKPILFALSSYTDSITHAYLVAKTIKSVFPNTTIVIGGSHTTFMYQKALYDCKEIDYVSIGEGEATLIELLEYITYGYPCIEKIKSIAYRDCTGRVCCTERRNYITNLDIMPLLYYPPELIEFVQKDGGLLFVSSRGCPGECIFCASRALSGNKYRYHSAEWIASLLYYYYEVIGYKTFSPLDDTFTVNFHRLRKVSKYIQQLGYHKKFSWSCKSRVDVINEKIAKMLQYSGCISMHIGVESGDPEVLATINKHITLEQVFKSIEILAKHNIRAECSFILGHPTDNKVSMEKTAILSNMLDTTSFSIGVIGICTPFPGTVIAQNRDEYGMKYEITEWKKFDIATPIFSTKEFTTDDVRRSYYYCLYGYRTSMEHPGIVEWDYKAYRENIANYIEKVENIVKERKREEGNVKDKVY